MTDSFPKIQNRIHGTCPIVLHSPNFQCHREQTLATLAKKVFASRPGRWRLDALTLLTWSDRQAGTTLLERCCDHLGVPLLVLRPDGDWENHQKIVLTAEAAKSITTPMVAGLDATDALLLGSLAEMVLRFTGFRGRNPKCRLLFSAEANHYPRGRDLHAATAWEKSHASQLGELPFCHLNTGGFIGHTAAVQHWFAEAATRPRSRQTPVSDQGVWRKFYREANGEVDIDRRCTIFQTVSRHDHGPVVDIL